MIAMIAAMDEKNSSAIEAICGFHMIAAIATIVGIEVKSISAILVAAIATIAVIAGEWFPYDRYDR